MEKGYFVMDKPRGIKPSHNEYVPSEHTRNKMTLSLSDPFHHDPPPYSNDYLTPASPKEQTAHVRQPPDLPAFPAGGFSRSPQSSVTSRGDNNNEESPLVHRADSGIEADFQRGQKSSTSSDYPRSSTIYECIDSNPQYVDPSPEVINVKRGRGEEGGSGSGSSGVPSPGVPSSGTMGPGVTAPWTTSAIASDSEDGGPLNDDVRRRLNPVYNCLNESTPQLYSPACHGCNGSSRGGARAQGTAANAGGASGGSCCKRSSSSSSATRHPHCLLGCGLALLTVFLVALLAYIFVFLVPGMEDKIHRQKEDIKRMDLAYQNLARKMDALLLSSIDNHTTSAPAKTPETTVLANNITELSERISSLDHHMQEQKAYVQNQIDSISRAPDLQGVRGVVNLTGCFHYDTSTMTALPGPPSFTPWLPETGSDMLRDSVVMSASCAVEGGTLQFAETRVVSPSFVQYRCRCEGQVWGRDRRICRIRLVMCPRVMAVHFSTSSS